MTDINETDVTDTDIAARYAKGGERHRLFGRGPLAERDGLVELDRFASTVIAGRADARDPQRQLLGKAKAG